jgi:EAL domain-containing protein (putative c-di-GMP-specific phosphodiesterase class I)
VIAEGVENTEQWQFLEKHHCKIAQGFLFSHPLSSEEISKLLADMPNASYFTPLNLSKNKNR